MRSYSVTEIVAMRQAVTLSLAKPGLSGDLGLRGASSDVVEEQLRTYMSAGVDPSELERLGNENITRVYELMEQRPPWLTR